MDTSQLLKDEQDIFSSPKVACFLKNDQLHSMVISTQVKNILSRIFAEKTFFRADMLEERALLGDRCLFTSDFIKIAKIIQDSDVFMLGEGTLMNMLMAGMSLLEGVFKKMWLNEKPLYEYNHV